MNTKKFHDVSNIKFEKKIMFIDIDGKSFSFQLESISKLLLKASSVERAAYKIHESGYGIHWPLIDEDLSIDSLLGIKHDSPFEKRNPITKKGRKQIENENRLTL